MRATKADYTNCKQKIISYFESRPDVLKVLTFGSVTVPGISDLDFLVVVKRNYKKISLKEILSTHEYGLVSHEPLIINQDILNHLTSFFFFTNLYDEYDKKRINLKYSDDELVLMLVDLCTHFYPRIFFNLQMEPNVSNRFAIQIINAMRHSVLLIEKLANSKIEGANNFFSKFDKYRLERSFTRGGVITWLKKSIPISIEMNGTMDRVLLDKYWRISFGSVDAAIFTYSGYVYSKNYSFKRNKVINDSLSSGALSVVPANYLVPHLVNQRNNNFIQKRFFQTYRNMDDLLYSLKRPDLKRKILLRYRLLSDYLELNKYYEPLHNYYNMVHSGIPLKRAMELLVESSQAR